MCVVGFVLFCVGAHSCVLLFVVVCSCVLLCVLVCRYMYYLFVSMCCCV